MKKTMFKLSAILTTLSSIIYAGGDISPVESSMEPAVAASSGDALGLSTVFILIGLTIMVGKFFTDKKHV